ncbi:MAG: hypothetical protein EOM87_08300, partial [Clostridia bacterium]|nr:hypothetical protein [Clostridia bacterium]
MKKIIFCLLIAFIIVNTLFIIGCSKNPIEITYITNGGIEIESSPVTKINELTVPVKNGYEFCGWYDNEELSGNKLKKLPRKTDSLTIYAKWSLIEGTEGLIYELISADEIIIPEDIPFIPPVFADFVMGEEENETEKNLYCVSGYEGASTNIFVPMLHLGLPVTAIKSKAFFDNKNIQSVTITNNVTQIGNSAFSGCSNLKNAILPDKLTALGKSCFADCFRLNSIKIPSSVERIRDNAFLTCRDLASLILPNELKEIDTSAFRRCESLVEVIIPSKITKIGAFAFSFCFKLKNVTILTQVPPTISYNSTTNITHNSATFNASFTQGDQTISLKGFKYKSQNDANWTTLQNLSTTSPFNANVNNLNPNTTYYVKSYITTQTNTYESA